MAWFRKQGYVALHNTKGAFDVMAAKGHPPFLLDAPLIICEVKSGKGRFDNYPPAERAQTLAAALQAGAVACEAHWKPYAREPDLIPSGEWP